MAEKSSELKKSEKKDNFKLEDQSSDAADDAERADKNQTDENQTNETNQPSAEISDDPAEIRGQIDDTRREMSETLTAIQEKLSVSNITEQVKEQVTEQITGALETMKTTVTDATLGKAGKFMKNIGKEFNKSNIGKMAGENPLPLVLIGLGIGLLAFGGFRKKSAGDYEKYRYRKGLNNSPNTASETEKPDGKSAGIAKNIGDSASAAYSFVGDAANNAYDKIGDFGGQLRGQYQNQLAENPLVVGAVVLAIGAAVGLAIPSTGYENQLMGETRENLLSQAQTAARGAFDKVQEVVGQAKETLVDSAKDVVNQAQQSITENLQSEQTAKPQAQENNQENKSKA